MSGGSSASARETAGPLRAELRAMSDRTRALLEYHFEHDPRQTFAIASSADAVDVVIADYDYPGARAVIDGGRWRDGPPLLVLAHGAADVDHALVLGKPLDRSSLDAAAARLREAAPGSRPTGRIGGASGGVFRTAPAGSAANARHVGESVVGAAEPPTIELASGRRRARPADPSAVAGAARDERARARVAALCGPPRTLAELADPADPAHRYDPARHLLRHLDEALATLARPDARALMLVAPDVELYVLPWLDRVCTSEPLTWSVGVDRVFRRLGDDDVERVVHGPATVNALVARVNEKACQAYPLAAFRWLAALFSARGRLPFGVDIERPLRLARWPNLARLELTPDCMPIVAEWTARPRSIAGMIDHLGCEPRHVSALYAATTAGDLLHPAAPTDDGDDDGT